MTTTFLRTALAALSTALLISCGGGGGGGGGGFAVGGAAVGTGAQQQSGLVVASGDTGSPSAGGGDGGGNSSTGGSAGGAAGGAAGAAGGGTSGGGTSGGGATASSGGDGAGGVGSGGTGVSTADAAGIGAVDGAGSIIVNGLRYNTDTATYNVEDTPELQLGMSVKVSGPVDADFLNGIARRVDSAADLRGTVSSINLGQGSFVILGSTITTDEATVWGNTTGLAAIVPGSTLQVWGLPAAPGTLRATRVEQRAPSTPILTGTVQNLDTLRRSFAIGGTPVDYGAATLSGSLDGRPLAEGTLVRVRASAVVAGRLQATSVQWWYPVPTANGTPVQLAGIVTDFAGLGSLRVLNVPVNAASARINGGPSNAVGNGVKVEVAGVMSNGVLQATKLKLRHVPGTGGPSSFSLIGTVGNFSSPDSFRVRGQPIDASGPGVVFVNGTAANLRSGAKVSVEGAQVIDGVLIATRVVFD
ncbi:DUF5666 domain-containing protein [Variovorax sp. KK3]|uniref:DUF5666 domain-containing protein n=1 Tax=Variovorax sp. KK3 TaxID=1855728 RepID=UPI00097C4CD7|nr:DUF5666 domain-containing protein [Variovorax sp. KK3]